jgi:tRNA(Ile)-lysidine synthetase-like protein
LVSITDDGMISLSNHFSIMFEQLNRADVRKTLWRSLQKDEAWIDAACIEKILLLRHFEQGDWFSPLGMTGKHRKLSDYFIDQKIPMNVREFFPLICDAAGVLWVVGQQIDDRCKITDQTQKILRLKLVWATAD